MKQWQKLFYAAGSLGTALSYQAFTTHIQFLYIDVFGLSAALIGTGWAIYGVWNAVNDPLAGSWSDRTRTRWGRRTPWIAATTGYVQPLTLAGAPAQPDAALWGMRALVTLLPIVASAITYWALARYPLHGERLAEVRRRLAGAN